jgi:arylsulfatase A-like enzyme
MSPRVVLPVAALVLGASVAAFLVTSSSRHRESARPPNILVIVTDEQRADQMGVMPRTLARFGRGGTRFSNAYDTTPLCCPSRASIMTGEYAHNHQVLVNTLDYVSRLDTNRTVQHHLHEAGYQTAMIGKYFNNWPIDRVPPDLDTYAVYGSPPGSGDLHLLTDGKESVPASLAADGLDGEAMRVLDRFERADDRPWFLYLAPLAAHWPYPISPKDQDRPVPAFRPGPGASETDLSDKPPELRNGLNVIGGTPADIWTKQERSLMGADRLIGAVFDRLDKLGEKNTLAFFISDNGYMLGEHRITEDKRVPYTESVHVPMFMRWPGHVGAGEVDDRLALNVDIAPTILEAARVPPDPAFDGRSLRGLELRNEVLLENYEPKAGPAPGLVPSWSSIRRRDLQYVEWYTPQGVLTWRELYILTTDPNELTSVIDGAPDAVPDTRVRALSERLQVLRRCGVLTTTCP